MGIRHQRAHHRYRQQTRLFHLHYRLMVQTLAPLPAFHGFRARRWWRIEQRLGKVVPEGIVLECRGAGKNGRNFFVQSGFVAATEDKFSDKIRRSPGHFAQRHAEAEKIFGVHINQKSARGIQSPLAAPAFRANGA